MSNSISKIPHNTFFQKLLGKNYKWWFLMQFRFKSRSVSSFDSMFFVAGHFLILIGTLLTWWLANHKIIDFSLKEKWVYFVVGELFFSIIYTFTEFLGFEIFRGNHVADLLKPQNYIKMKFFFYYGEAFLQNLTKFVILFTIFLIFVALRITIPNFNFLISLLFLPISLLILYLSGFMAACNGFYMTSMNGIVLNYTFLSGLLMGRIFPLDLLISNFWFNLINPFAFTFYHPMQIYLGKYDTFQTFLVFLGGIFWCIFLYFLAKLVFKMGLKKNESVGL